MFMKMISRGFFPLGTIASLVSLKNLFLKIEGKFQEKFDNVALFVKQFHP